MKILKKAALLLTLAAVLLSSLGIGAFAGTEYWSDHTSEVTPTQYAYFDKYIVSNGSELAYVMKLLENNEMGDKQINIEFANDIDLSEYVWTPIYEKISGLLKLRGDGHRITGLNTQGLKSGLFWYVDNAEFYDLTVEGTVAGAAEENISIIYGGVAMEARNCSFTGVCSNVVFDKNVECAGGIVGSAVGDVSFLSCAFVGSFANNAKSGGILWNYYSASNYTYSLSIQAVVVKNANNIIYYGNISSYDNNDIIAILDSTASMADVAAKLNKFYKTITNNPNSYPGTNIGALHEWRSIDGQAPTTTVFTGPSDDEFIFAADGLLNEGWLVVNTAAEFAAAAEVLNSNDEGAIAATITLGGDIDLTNVDMEPIACIPQNVTLDGNGNSLIIGKTLVGANEGIIKNLEINSSGSVKGTVIGSDFIVATDTIAVVYACGGVAAINSGTISNVVMNADVDVGAVIPDEAVSPDEPIPMSIGDFETDASAELMSSGEIGLPGRILSSYAGGLVGINLGTIENCAFTGKLTYPSVDEAEFAVGGIAGAADAGSYTNGYCSNRYLPIGTTGVEDDCEALTDAQMTGTGSGSLLGRLNSWIAKQKNPSDYTVWYMNNGSLSNDKSEAEALTGIGGILTVFIPNHLYHTWGEWTVDRLPTKDADGSKSRVCELCHETETRVIPAYGGNYPEFTDVSASDSEAVSTCAALNILNGRTKTKFYPNRVMSVGEAATAAAKAYQFVHEGEVSLADSDCIDYAVKNGLLASGTDAGKTATVEALCGMLGIKSADGAKLTRSAAATILADYIG